MINTLAYMNFEVGLLILAGVLVMFGGKKIPELFRGIGQGVGELKKGMEEGQRTLVNSIHHHETETHPTTPVVVEPVQTAVPATETKVTA